MYFVKVFVPFSGPASKKTVTAWISYTLSIMSIDNQLI